MSNELKVFKRIWELSKDSPYMAKMEKPDVVFEGKNTSCGDWIEVSLKCKKGKIMQGRFLHTGCAVSAVATSVLLEYLEGKTFAALQKISPEKHLALFGAPVSPARLACALLPLEILRTGKKKAGA